MLFILYCFLLLNNGILLCGYITFCLSIHQLMDILGCFHFLVIVNKAMNIYGQVFVWTCFISSGWILRSRIAGSCNNSMFNIFINCQTLKRLYHVPFPPTIYKGSNFSTNTLFPSTFFFFFF